MVKKILFIVSALLLTGYLAFAVAFLNPKAKIETKCSGLEVEVVETDIPYLDEAQVIASLQRRNLNPVGKEFSDISLEALEKALEENKLIKEVESYKTVGGVIKVKVYQRTPVLRVISENGNYYIDSERERMPVPPNFAAYVPLVTGKISEEYAKHELYDFVLFLQKNKYWNSQIEQIHIDSNLDVELMPRKGNHHIILGKIEDYKENLDKLKLFYDKGLDKVGWNRYSVINLKYKNQVVCTKTN
jgi:cell division protein FtsQ